MKVCVCVCVCVCVWSETDLPELALPGSLDSDLKKKRKLFTVY